MKNFLKPCEVEPDNSSSSKKQSIILVAAMSRNWVIGYQNQLPWHMPADLHYFKKTTQGKTVIMGRKTFDSIGKRPLPNRRNIVISHQIPLEQPANYEWANTLESALYRAQHYDSDIMIIGGQTIYEQALPLSTDIYITIIDVDVLGDTFFPRWEPEQWAEIERLEHKADEENPYDYVFLKLRRI